MGKQSTQLAQFVKWEKTTIGPKNTPAVNVTYTRLDGDYAGKELTVRYLVGTLDEASGEVLKSLKAGTKFVVVKEEMPNKSDPKKPYWNLKEFRKADTFVEKPAYTSGKGNYGAKKEYDTTGVKVGAARNNAVAILSATGALSGLSIQKALDLVDEVSFQIVSRQEAQEIRVKKEGIEDADNKKLESDKQNQQSVDLEPEGLAFDDDIPF